ncbi:MAG TPA: hypothetical protein VIE65_07350 [Methylobacter sp.]
MPEDVVVWFMISKIEERITGLNFQVQDSGRKIIIKLLHSNQEELVRLWLSSRRNGQIFLHIETIRGPISSHYRDQAFQVKRQRIAGEQQDEPSTECLAQLIIGVIIIATATDEELMEATWKGIGISAAEYEKWKNQSDKYISSTVIRLIIKRIERIISIKDDKIIRRFDNYKFEGPHSIRTISNGIICLEKAWDKIPNMEIRKNIDKLRGVFKDLIHKGFDFNKVKRIWEEETINSIMNQ